MISDRKTIPCRPVRFDGATQTIWLSDVSVLAKQEDTVPWDVISTFTEISDLKGAVSSENNDGATGTIIEHLIHDLINRRSTIRVFAGMVSLSLSTAAAFPKRFWTANYSDTILWA